MSRRRSRRRSRSAIRTNARKSKSRRRATPLEVKNNIAKLNKAFRVVPIYLFRAMYQRHYTVYENYWHRYNDNNNNLLRIA